MHRNAELFPKQSPVEYVTIKGGHVNLWQHSPFPFEAGEGVSAEWCTNFLISNEQ